MAKQKDLYETLGVQRSATADEIDKAYRNLAKQFHPDLNPGKKEAEDRFKEISAAYSIISDDEKRARYDRGEIDASGQEQQERKFYRNYADAGNGAHYTYSAQDLGGFGNIGDIFAEMFSERAGQSRGGRTIRRRGNDMRYELAVDFLDAINGATKRIALPDGQALDVTIPKGLRDGQVLRLKGKGTPGSGGAPAGDALVAVSVKPHPLFDRKGNHIHIDVPISLGEAVLGGKIEVPTPAGPLNVTVPADSGAGKTLRLKGKGVPKQRNAEAGDLYVHLAVMLPAAADDDLKAFVEKWAAEHPYDVRKDMSLKE
ncbi:MAG: J domain-containing protein [Proteobacteria bacterium]|nr:J domain-containing protein [Pseudomonadota bacterium]